MRGDILRLVIFIVGDIELDKLAVTGVCPQLLALAPLIVADNGVRRVKDMACTAVVLLKADSAAAFKLAFKGENVFYGRAAELIYALIVITYNAYISPAPGEEGGEHIL